MLDYSEESALEILMKNDFSVGKAWGMIFENEI